MYTYYIQPYVNNSPLTTRMAHDYHNQPKMEAVLMWIHCFPARIGFIFNPVTHFFFLFGCRHQADSAMWNDVRTFQSISFH